MVKIKERRTIVKRVLSFIMVLSFVVLAADQASGQDLIVYPAKGQSQKQMEKDKFDCYSWAKQQSGFDPMQTPPPAPAPPPPPGSAAGGVVRGGAGGAALGAAVGGIAGGWSGAGKGAAIGALTGGVFGGLRSQARNYQSAQNQQQLAAQQSAQYRQKRDAYNRASSVCLEAKGYKVK
jgi:predicted lipid-binding transport protein (Tim44 family)